MKNASVDFRLEYSRFSGLLASLDFEAACPGHGYSLGKAALSQSTQAVEEAEKSGKERQS
jgi:hypothetical protein